VRAKRILIVQPGASAATETNPVAADCGYRRWRAPLTFIGNPNRSMNPRAAVTS
jgi:hypothetical protein